MTDQQYADTLMGIMTDIHNNSYMLRGVLDQCEILAEMDDDPMVHARHRHNWDIEAAIIGNTWLADSCLLEYTELVSEAIPWVETLASIIIEEEETTENEQRCLEIVVSLLVTGTEQAKRVLGRFGDAIENNIIQVVRETLQIFNQSVNRKTILQMIKEEAYSDPSIAALAELTKGGLKTRNRFYKRD